MTRFSDAAALAAVLISGGVALAPRPAVAQFFGGSAVFCTNCSTEGSSLAGLAKQAQQIAQQLAAYQLQGQQYMTEIQNTVALPMTVWSNAQSDIMAIRNLSNAASVLTGRAGSMIGRLQSASAYASSAASLPANIGNQFTEWQQTIGTNIDTLGRTLGLQQNQQASNTALLAALQAHAATAQGQMQALTAGNELAHANAVQLQEIEQTLIATAQLQANAQAVAADRQAQQDAEMLRFANPTATPLPLTGQAWR